ncbi:MAG: peptide-methionine (S)-S-oxide reductase MsrA [Alphaproteobacteria bacterium]
MAKTIVGAGCFWGVEATFRQLPGVRATAVGYAGGATENPTYKHVCTGQTGHAEVVEIEFDEEALPLEELLKVFWECHDPTQVDRQGHDVGTQYRSVIFSQDQAQQDAAEASKSARNASGLHLQPIATQIAGPTKFWRAEDYHQQYFAKRNLANCPAQSTGR